MSAPDRADRSRPLFGCGELTTEPRIVGDRYTLRRLGVTLAGTASDDGAAVTGALVEGTVHGCVLNEMRARGYGLAQRDIAVARLIADGLTTPRIAASLEESVYRARRHTRRS